MVSYVATLAVLVTLNFFLPRAMPGDPISAMLAMGGGTGSAPTEAEQEAVRLYYGLDRPLSEQYGEYLSGLAKGDLGLSIRYHRPVRDVLAERLPWTLLLGASSVSIAISLGLLAGVQSGWRRGRAVDRVLFGAFTALRGVPPFFLASAAVYVFAVKLGWAPLFGAQSRFAEHGLAGQVADIARHLALPALTTAILLASGPYLLMRAGMVGELGADYLRLGRAKGLSERRLKYRYAARNALLPLVTISALELGVVLSGGLIFVETVFAYPGVGRLMFEAANFRDYPSLQGGFLVLTVVVVTLNFLAEVVYGRLDPRATA